MNDSSFLGPNATKLLLENIPISIMIKITIISHIVIKTETSLRSMKNFFKYSDIDHKKDFLCVLIAAPSSSQTLFMLKQMWHDEAAKNSCIFIC